MATRNSEAHAFSDVAEKQPNSNRLVAMARERMRESTIPFTDALLQIKRENPSLAEAANYEVIGHRRSFDAPYTAGGVMASEGAAVTPSPSELFVTLTERRCGEMSISYRQAMAEVAHEYPELAGAARRQVLGME